MEISWGDALADAYKSRKELAAFVKKGLTLLLGRKTLLAVTGMQGAGKTVLHDYLSGRAYESDYETPMQSQRKETGKIKGRTDDGKKQVLMTVIPGQTSEIRHSALDDVFKQNDTDGVLHVVANGFATIRKQSSIDVLVKDQKLDTIEKLRAAHRASEVGELKETCERIVQSQRRCRKPSWLIVVVGKTDLYPAELQEARDYYSPTSGSQFGQVLADLQRRVGSDFIRFDEVPMACHLEGFEWNGHTTPTNLATERRDQYVAQLLKLIMSYCS
jgi:hypothetical protein